MLVTLRREKSVISVPFVMILCCFFGVYWWASIAGLMGSTLATMLFTLFMVLLISIVLCSPWFLLLYKRGDDLNIAGLLKKGKVHIPHTRFVLLNRFLCLQDKNRNMIVSLMPYAHERNKNIVQSLHDAFGIDSTLDTPFRENERAIHKWGLFMGASSIVVLFLCLMVIYYLFYCRIGLICSPRNFFNILSGGTREMVTIGREVVNILQHGYDSNPPFDEVQQPKEENAVSAYMHTNPPLSFFYPASWGEVQIQVHSDGRTPEGYDSVMVFSGLGWKSGTNIGIGFTTFSEQQHTFDRCYEGSCVTTNMVEERALIEERNASTIAGHAAAVKDTYFAPAANIVRRYAFYTDAERVEIFAGYSLMHLYEEEYEKRRMRGEMTSILGLIREDMGNTWVDVSADIEAFMRKHPDEVVLKRFVEDVHGMVQSLRLDEFL